MPEAAGYLTPTFFPGWGRRLKGYFRPQDTPPPHTPIQSRVGTCLPSCECLGGIGFMLLILVCLAFSPSSAWNWLQEVCLSYLDDGH